MDIAFSIDSVIAAFGVSNEVWVLFMGGLLGVLMMRGVAQVFLKLIDKIPELERAAFLLIAIIATTTNALYQKITPSSSIKFRIIPQLTGSDNVPTTSLHEKK